MGPGRLRGEQGGRTLGAEVVDHGLVDHREATEPGRHHRVDRQSVRAGRNRTGLGVLQHEGHPVHVGMVEPEFDVGAAHQVNPFERTRPRCGDLLHVVRQCGKGTGAQFGGDLVGAAEMGIERGLRDPDRLRDLARRDLGHAVLREQAQRCVEDLRPPLAAAQPLIALCFLDRDRPFRHPGDVGP